METKKDFKLHDFGCRGVKASEDNKGHEQFMGKDTSLEKNKKVMENLILISDSYKITSDQFNKTIK